MALPSVRPATINNAVPATGTTAKDPGNTAVSGISVAAARSRAAPTQPAAAPAARESGIARFAHSPTRTPIPNSQARLGRRKNAFPGSRPVTTRHHANDATAQSTPVSGTVLLVTQLRSSIGCKQNQRQTLLALGLRKIRQTRDWPDPPQVRGMIHTVRHLVAVEEVESK